MNAAAYPASRGHAGPFVHLSGGRSPRRKHHLTHVVEAALPFSLSPEEHKAVPVTRNRDLSSQRIYDNPLALGTVYALVK